MPMFSVFCHLRRHLVSGHNYPLSPGLAISALVCVDFAFHLNPAFAHVPTISTYCLLGDLPSGTCVPLSRCLSDDYTHYVCIAQGSYITSCRAYHIVYADHSTWFAVSRSHIVIDPTYMLWNMLIMLMMMLNYWNGNICWHVVLYIISLFAGFQFRMRHSNGGFNAT